MIYPLQVYHSSPLFLTPAVTYSGFVRLSFWKLTKSLFMPESPGFQSSQMVSLNRETGCSSCRILGGRSYQAAWPQQSTSFPTYTTHKKMKAIFLRSCSSIKISKSLRKENRVGVLGVCAGGGYAVNAAMTKRRIKAGIHKRESPGAGTLSHYGLYGRRHVRRKWKNG